MAGLPVSKDSQIIGSRMKQILKQKGITQEKAAFLLDLSGQSTLNSYLSGRTEIPLNVINKFCATFDVPIAALFSGDEIVVNTEDDLVLDIMLAIDEFLAEKHLSLTSDQRRKMVKDFLAKDCHDPQVIKSTLSIVLAVNSETFTKGK